MPILTPSAWKQKPTGSTASCGIVKLWIAMLPIIHPEPAWKCSTGEALGDSVPVDQRRREPRDENRQRLFLLRAPADQPGQTRDVIGMLVRDHDGVEVFGLFADLGQPARQFPHAEASVDQNPGLRSGKKRRITRTAAREYAKPDQETILLRSVLTQNDNAYGPSSL